MLTNQKFIIYTVFVLLIRMKDQLGLEAMLEYISKYVQKINDQDSKFEWAVNTALTKTSVARIYKDAMNEQKSTTD